MNRREAIATAAQAIVAPASPEDAEIIRNSPEKGGTPGFTTIPPDSSIAEVIARQMIEEEKSP